MNSVARTGFGGLTRSWAAATRLTRLRRLKFPVPTGGPRETHYAARVCAFALVELGDSESIDLFVREEDAERALAECLGDEPDWTGLLYVVPIELDERRVSAN
jgi:hypothetical protein